jgi:phosphomannomutase
MAAIETAFGGRADAVVDHLDGLTVDLADGSWFNVRPSNTEPLLRLNVEAPDAASMSALRDEVLALVRGG